MKKNLSWISVTSIIPHPDTNNLLTSFTNQFLSPNKKCLEFYQFKFDFERQCIIFIVAINDQIEQLIGKLNNFFNTYHNRKDSLYFLENIELPHLNTTFQFKEAANAGFKRYLQFQQELSMLLENVFKEDSFQEESVPTLAYYLQLILINVVVGSFPSYRDELLKLSQIESKKFLLYENKIRVEIIKNKDLLIEIADDIFLGKDLAKSISWFAQWTLACSHQFKNIKVSKKYTVNDVKNLLEDLLLLIDHQLWLRKENSTVLRAIIEFSISHLFFDQRFEKMLIKSYEKNNFLSELYKIKISNIEDKLNKIDKKFIPEGLAETRLFMVVRNESLRLPFFFKYYAKLGVDRFFIIDNSSTDDTVEIALELENAHVFQTRESYKEHWDWMNFLLEKYGKNRWCVVVDADELLSYPYAEYLSLKKVIAFLESQHYSALESVLLDVYSDLPIAEAYYNQGSDPVKCCPYFDHHFSLENYVFFDEKKSEYFERMCRSGGVRSRFFSELDGISQSFCLTKFSLFKYLPETYLVQGMHNINGANVADISGVVFHSKFMMDFLIKVCTEASREEHYNDAIEYKNYKYHLDNNKGLTFKDDKSLKYTNTKQLLDLNIMTTSEKFNEFYEKLDSYKNP